MNIKLNLGLNLRKVIILLICLKLLFLDSAISLAFAQDDFELYSVNSNPVSYFTSNTAKSISTSSSPVSYSINNANMSIIAFANPVSLITALTPTTILIRSNPVSYSLLKKANDIKISSNPVSYLLSSFSGMTITTSTEKVSYRVYDGMPILSNISPNVLPVKNDNTSYEVRIFGDNFAKGAVVSIGTNKIDTKYISTNELSATLPVLYINKINSFNCFVINPPPSGSISNGVNVKIVDPVPVANITANPNIGVLPQIVSFDGTQSEDLLAKFFGSKTQYLWDFGDKNSTLENPNISEEGITSHKYTAAGKYQVKLQILNANNKASTLTKEIEIRDRNDAPSGTVTASTTKADVPVNILFNSIVTDAENDTISYFWDFGDGNISKSPNNQTNISHTYTSPGNYEPKLIVTDALGAKTVLSSPSLKLLPPNNPPIVELSAIPQKSTLKSNNENLFTSTVHFVSKGTFDKDEERLDYVWDFGDGENSSEPNPIHEYSMSGEYTVRLTARDERNAKVEKSISVSIAKPLPIPAGTLSETTGTVPLEVTFDARKSVDYDGKPITLKWDFGDGNSQLVDSLNEPIKHIYENPGVYLVTLIASTPDNRIKRLNPGNIIVNPNNAPIGQIIKIEGDEKGILGNAKVKLSCKGSFDPSGDMLKYNWTWSGRTWDGNGNLNDISTVINTELSMSEPLNNTEEFNYTFTKVGQFTPVLEIIKTDNSKYKYYGETVTVLEDQAPIAIAKLVNPDNEIITGNEISFDGLESYDPNGNGIKLFTWDFGDGTTSNEVSPKHTYNMAGIFTPTLTVVSNDNKIGFAQALSVSVSENVLENTHITSTNNLSRSLKLQVSNDTENNSGENIDDVIKTMINEQVFSLSSNDSEKPEIGPISLEPKAIYQGDSILLSAFIKDNVYPNTFSYTVYAPSGKIIIEKAITLVDENEIKNEKHILESINIPSDSEVGIYKIKFSGSDNSGNQLAFASNTGKNEEVSSTFEVKNKLNDTDSITQNAEKIIIPQITTDISAEALENIKTKSNGYNTKNYKKTDKNKTLHKTINRKARLSGFNTTGYQAVSNNFVVSNGTQNALSLNQIYSSPGSVTIGASGTLSNINFSKWTFTNVYVDGLLIGSIPSKYACKINFETTLNNPLVRVEFRPLNNLGIELSSNTWTSKDFIFIKNIAAPTISSINPAEVIEGRGSSLFKVSGNNFNNTTKIYINGNQITPYSLSATNLEAFIPASYTVNPGQSSIYVLNSDGQKSNLKDLIIKTNPNNACNLDKTLPKTIYGGEALTKLDGNDVYPNGIYSVINGSGSVSIPFCLDQTSDIKSSIKLSYSPINNQNAFAYIWLDNSVIGTLNLGTSAMTYEFIDFNTSTLNSGEHKLKISYSGQVGNKLIVENATFKNGSGPVINSISPNSIPQQGITRISINGKNFDSGTKLYFDGKLQTILSQTNTKITFDATSDFNQAGIKEIKLEGNGKLASIGISVRDKIDIVNSSFKINPIQPFPGTSFDIEVKANDSLSSQATYIADFDILDPDGKLLLIPGISSYSTLQVIGSKANSGEIRLTGSIPLSIYSKPGNYKAYVSVRRESALGLDYCNFESFKFIAQRATGLSGDDTLVPASYKLSFTPKPAIDFNIGLEENNIENTGFNPTMAIPIQDNQEVKIKLNQIVGSEYSSMIKYNFISSDNRSSGLISDDSYSFRYSNKNTLSSIPIIYNTNIEIYWIENGIQSKIRNIVGPNIIVYPNYKPIAKARVLSEQYPVFAKGGSLSTAFIDSGSYDPNEHLSKAIDYIDAKDNKWELFKILSNNSNKLYPNSTPIFSDDKKTFYSGNIVDYGSYFAKLTVTDKTGLSDSATTESVTVAPLSQRVGIFATTDPPDKKIYEETTVMFKSTVFGTYKTISYQWDFGDGTCKLDSDYKECYEANPTHNYFDGKKSFNGAMFTDRRSVTPKVMIRANFGNGTSESWEASAGTITFNNDPRLVLLDLKADINAGIIPFTVNLMIDPLTLKVVNATPIKYELDWADGTVDTGIVHPDATSLQTLSFTHTYTTANAYIPTLKIYIAESNKIFEFKVGELEASARGEGGIYLLDDLNSVSITNQPIVTFMVNTIFSNPNDKKNSLKIVVKDNENNESITELLPNSNNQTISLSEGKNTYYFEAMDSSSQSQMSEVREIVLDTNNPFIEVTSPKEEDIVIENSKIYFTGIVSDENLHSVLYKLNDDKDYTEITNLEDLTKNEKFFSVELDQLKLGNLKKISLLVKDTAGNESKEIVDFGNVDLGNKTVKHQTQIPGSNITYVYNTSNDLIEVKSGKPFALVTLDQIFDDMSKPGTTAVSPFLLDVLSPSSISVTRKSDPFRFPTYFNLYGKDLDVLPYNRYTDVVTGQVIQQLGGDLDGYTTPIPVFESSLLNFDKSNFFDLISENRAGSAWRSGEYEISQILMAHPNSVSYYGTSFSSGNSTLNTKFMVKITRNAESNIYGVGNNRIELGKENVINFNLVLFDSDYFNSDIHDISATINTPTSTLTPSNTINISNLTCTNAPNTIFPTPIITKNCSFKYKPEILSSTYDPYILNVNSIYPDSSKVSTSESFSVNFQTPAIITDPKDYKVLVTNSKNIDLNIQVLKSALPESYRTKPTSEIYALAHTAIKIPGQPSIVLASTSNDLSTSSTSKDPTSDSIFFNTQINLNLAKNKLFTNYFNDLSIFGPVYLNSIISSFPENEVTFEGTESKKIILLDNPKIKSGELINNNKTGYKQFNVNVKNNAPSTVEVKVTPLDLNQIPIGSPIDRAISIDANGYGMAVIKDLPPETNFVKVDLNRTKEFLDNIEQKILNENWSDSGFNKNEFKTVESRLFQGKPQKTSIDIAPPYARANGIDKVTLKYAFKDFYALTVETAGKLLDSKKYEIVDPSTNPISQYSSNGESIITIPTAWSKYSEVVIRFMSKNETDTAVLKIIDNNSAAFNIGDSDDKIASFNGKTISVKQLKELLFTLGYLNIENENGYTEATRDAFAKFICDYHAVKLNLNIQSNLKNQTTLQSSCSIDSYPNFTPKEEEISEVLEVQQFLKGLIDSNIELYEYIKKDPQIAAVVLSFSALSGIALNISTGGIKVIIGTIFASIGIPGTIEQIDNIAQRVESKAINGIYYQTGYATGEIVKIVGITKITTGTFKVGEELGFSYSVVKSAEKVRLKGLNDLYITILGQLSRLNKAADAEKVAIKAGLDRFLQVINNLEDLSIFKDQIKLWNIQDPNQVLLLRETAYSILNQIVSKFDNKETFFKMYENDPEGFITGIIKNILIDKRLQVEANNKNISLVNSVANGIKNKSNGTYSSITQQFENDGLILTGNPIPKAQVKPILETLVTVDDLKQFYLSNSPYKDLSNEKIIIDIKSGVLTFEDLSGEIRGRTASRFWTDNAEIDALKNTSNYTKDYIVSDNVLALDMKPPIKPQVRLIISTEKLPDNFFRIPTAIEGSRKFVPAPYNNNIYNGKTLGGYYEVISPPVSTQNVIKIEVIE